MLGCLMALALAGDEAVREVGFIYESAPFKSCHASTVVETKDGLLAAWFGGSAEGRPDVGIWTARRENGKWAAPVEVANGVESPEKRHPTWNPVLFQPLEGPLLLFYKMGPSPSTWWGMLLRSEDRGRTWSKPERLPDGIVGPVKNKPVQLASGEILCGSSSEHDGWRVHIERSADGGRSWTKTGPLNDGRSIGAIQPSLLVHPGGRLQALGRSRQKQVWEAWSDDGGRTWGPMALTALPNPNSGTDALTLRDGRHVLIYNHTPRGRSPLNLALSEDGKSWKTVLTLEQDPGEYSYPAIIQAGDGLLHATWTWKRERIRHAVIDPAKLK